MSVTNDVAQAQAERCAMFLQGYWTACILVGEPLPKELAVHVQVAQFILNGILVAEAPPRLVTEMIETVERLEMDAHDKSNRGSKFNNTEPEPAPARPVRKAKARPTRRIVTTMNGDT